MNRPIELFTVASWEPRFVLGMERLLATHDVSRIEMFFMKEYADRTAMARTEAETKARGRDIPITQHSLSTEKPAETWKALYDYVFQRGDLSEHLLVDMSTMPREVLWLLVDFLLARSLQLKYVYHRPDRYNADWLSRDPGNPRLVYKLGGEAQLGIPTALVVLSGFDVDRVKQLVRWFEPQKVLLGLQKGKQFDNLNHNVNRVKREFQGETQANMFELDAYGPDHGYADILDAVQPYLADHNVIMSSLGPKPSAIALYQMHQKYPSCGLAYAPSGDFNLEYSFGLGDSVEGILMQPHRKGGTS